MEHDPLMNLKMCFQVCILYVLKFRQKPKSKGSENLLRIQSLQILIGQEVQFGWSR